MTIPDIPVYVPRSVRFAGLHLYGGWWVKVYTIDADGDVRSDDVLATALGHIPLLLPGTVEGGRASISTPRQGLERAAGATVHGEAFAILHAGADAVWLLVHWWTDGCLLHHRMVAAGLDDPTSFTIEVPDTLIACSWELAVVQHEREAWVRRVQGAGPDADYAAYRADVLPDGPV